MLGRESLNDVQVTPAISVIPDSDNQHIGSPDCTLTIPDTCKVPIDNPEVPQITKDNEGLHSASPETNIIDQNSFLNPLPIHDSVNTFPDIPVTVNIIPACVTSVQDTLATSLALPITTETILDGPELNKNKPDGALISHSVPVLPDSDPEFQF